MAKAAKKSTPKKAVKKTSLSKTRSASQPKIKMSEAEEVELYMQELKSSFKEEIQAVRDIIKTADTNIRERIKWKAPSYYYNDEDMVTFNGWADKNVHLVFHHPAIVKIKSDLLEGNYDKRRMMYFNNMQEVKTHKKELQRIIRELISFIE